MDFLSCNSISKSFLQGSESISVLNDITFKFIRGHSYAITGESGSGKSTLLHILSGMLTPDVGVVCSSEGDIYSFGPASMSNFLKNAVGLVFQLPYLIREISVLENIMIKGLINNDPYNDCIARARELLSAVGLPHKANSHVSELSGGEAQRIAIARAIYFKPQFLLADEPTAHLDESSKRSIIDLLLEFQRIHGLGLIIVTHDNSVAASMENNLRLSSGKLAIINGLNV